MKTFSELSIQKPLHRALEEMNFNTPTPIQAEAIPVALAHRDLIACAQTGTGKTAAFSIPILSSLMKNTTDTALILVPTRELATQVTDVLRALTKYAIEMRVVSIIGGMSMQPQTRALGKGFRIIVATPGRLCDHLAKQPHLLSTLTILTLDEADRMLDMGFAPQLKRIFGYLPKKRQTLLFSATIPQNIEELAQNLLHNPVQVKIGKSTEAATEIQQQSRFVRGEDKNATLLDELNVRKGTVLIFARTQRRTDRVANYLEEYGINVTSIHGGRSQGQRNRAINGFRDGTFRVMVATDIAARGIDIDHVAHVINYDLPEVPEDYIHRIGRTARAGRGGESMSFIASDEKQNWVAIQKLLNMKTGSETQGKAWSGMDDEKGKKRERRPAGSTRSTVEKRPENRTSKYPERSSGKSSHFDGERPARMFAFKEGKPLVRQAASEQRPARKPGENIPGFKPRPSQNNKQNKNQSRNKRPQR